MLITVIAYMCKDRMKEWGKRYLEPVCVKLGFEFPDRIVKVGSARNPRRVSPLVALGPLCLGQSLLGMRFLANTYIKMP